jgi:hypothetical protein
LAFHAGREADHLPPSSAEVKEWVDLYILSHITPSWRGAQLGGAQGQLYLMQCIAESLEMTKWNDAHEVSDTFWEIAVYKSQQNYRSVDSWVVLGVVFQSGGLAFLVRYSP